VYREGSSFRPTTARFMILWQQQLKCEWKTSEMWGKCSGILSQLASDNVLATPSVLFSVGLLRTKFQDQSFLFSSLWQYGREKYSVPTATKNLKGESFSYESFSGKFGEIRANYSFHEKLPAPTPMPSTVHFWLPWRT